MSFDPLSPSKKPLEKILLEAGLISIYQIEVVFQEQKYYEMQIEEILAAHGWIKQKTADFFVRTWSKLLQKSAKRPLAFYLHAAGLLDQKQLLDLKQKQRQRENEQENRLHELAVELGYVKQETVNFFYKNLFEISKGDNLSVIKPYEVIKNYINGKCDFRGLELSQAVLNGVSLEKVIFDNSNLKQANLSKCNLSYSSLIESNLAFADLRLA